MKPGEAEREIGKLSWRQLEAIERDEPIHLWSNGRRAKWIWQEAIMRGFLLGPA